MSSTKPLRIAFLGAGIFATEAYLPALAQLTSSLTLLAIYSHTLRSASTLAETAQKSLSLPSKPAVYHDEGGVEGNLEALLKRDDIDAVIIITPINLLPKFVTAALTHGKHVLSEKPVAPTVAEGLKLIEQYEQTWKGKLVWKVAENYEVEPAFRKIGDLIKEGSIGKVAWWKMSAVIGVTTDNKYYKTPWRTVPEGGFIMDGGVHAAAVLRTALPSHPTSVSAHASLTQEHLAPCDTLTAIVRSSDGSHGVLEYSMGAPLGSRSDYSFVISGNKGWIGQTMPDRGSFRVALHTPASERDDKGSENEQTFDFQMTGVLKELEHFVDAISGRDEGIGEPRGALRDVAFIQAGLESKGNEVDVEKLVEGL